MRADRLTADWVRQYVNPDGIATVGVLAQSRLTPQLAAQLDPSRDRETLLRNWSDELANPAPSDALTRDNLGHAQLPVTVDLTAQLLLSVTRRLFAVVPSLQAMRQDAQTAITGAAHATLLRSLLDAVAHSATGAFDISRFDARRLELEIARRTRDPQYVLVSADVVRAFIEHAIEIAQQQPRDDVNFDELNRNAARLRQFVGSHAQVQGREIVAGLEAVASKVVLDDPFLDHPRARVDVPALTLVSKLDPAVTVPRRVLARLTASQNLPGWLRPDWFADQRVEPVMAHPRFHYPMYEPLQRYDRDWMIPGLGLIKKPDMATLLQTNNRFIEAYLVGLNHEMAASCCGVNSRPTNVERISTRSGLDARSLSPTCTSCRGWLVS